MVLIASEQEVDYSCGRVTCLTIYRTFLRIDLHRKQCYEGSHVKRETTLAQLSKTTLQDQNK